MEVSIRPALPGDEKHIFRMIVELARFAGMEREVTGTAEALARHLFGERPTAEALVAERGNAVIGYALFYPTFSTFLARPGLYLEDLYVMEQERGTGVGKALLRGVARVARARDAARLEWLVLDWNTRALDFYVSSGATLLGDRRTCRVSERELEQLGASET